MGQFRNAASNFGDLASGGDRHWLLVPTTWLQKMGKAICFHKIDPKIMPKRKDHKISTIFSMCMCKRQDGQNWYS